MKKFKIEKIICPDCSTIQIAKIKFTMMWPVYIHECVHCKYMIMESDWRKI
jgi:hypothetical protein